MLDDGSPSPRFPELLEEVSDLDPRIRWRRRAENGGISAATNEALDIAGGDYIALLDHDDMIHPDALTEMIAAMMQGDADAAYSDTIFVVE